MVDRTREEFSRQAAVMSSSSVFNDERTLQRMGAALAATADDRVLEVACGPGIVAAAIAPLVGELVCIDATAKMIDLARKRLHNSGKAKVYFLEGLAEQLPFSPGSFAALVTRLSLHHFADVPKVLSEFRRVLQPGGQLLVADIITSSDDQEAGLHNALEQLRDPSHIRMLSREELFGTLRSCGFEPVAWESWQQLRTFAEWARIVSDPTRTGPLLEVMRALSHAGLGAGIQMRESDGDLAFVHTWQLVSARVTDGVEP
jgi:ubiquinone/menaquinone biosynthesis C-methylase UbiE